MHCNLVTLVFALVSQANKHLSTITGSFAFDQKDMEKAEASNGSKEPSK